MHEWTWVELRDGVLDADDSTAVALIEEASIVEWMEAGAPVAPKPMPKRVQTVDLPAVALTVSRVQAAELLSVSVDFFDDRVMPDLRVIHKGSRVLVPVRELEGWVERNTARPLRGGR